MDHSTTIAILDDNKVDFFGEVVNTVGKDIITVLSKFEKLWLSGSFVSFWASQHLCKIKCVTSENQSSRIAGFGSSYAIPRDVDFFSDDYEHFEAIILDLRRYATSILVYNNIISFTLGAELKIQVTMVENLANMFKLFDAGIYCLALDMKAGEFVVDQKFHDVLNLSRPIVIPVNHRFLKNKYRAENWFGIRDFLPFVKFNNRPPTHKEDVGYLEKRSLENKNLTIEDLGRITDVIYSPSIKLNGRTYINIAKVSDDYFDKEESGVRAKGSKNVYFYLTDAFVAYSTLID